ncbi:MAG: hypothetical protein J6T25_02525 [Bacilli bacterium]|nr:hypothetical protein [Bacilli bacterium]
MKKGLLLIALPALMALSACGNARVNEKQDNYDYFKEDTVAHEEYFGGAELAPQKLGVPDEEPVGNPDWTLMPKVGVQFQSYEKDANTFYAVRYVAAVGFTSLDGVTASWTRGVSQKDSTQVRAMSGGHNSTELYASLNNGGTPKAATSEGTGYNNYIVYSMYDIPASQSGSYIVAYLTLSKAGETTFSTRAVATQIDGSHYFSFDIEEEIKKDGYFIQSNSVDGLIQQDLDAGTDPNDDGKDNAQFTDIVFAAGNKFGLFRFTPTIFQFFGYNAFLKDTSARFIKSTNIDEYNELYLPGTYSLFLNKDNLVYTSPVSVETKLYVRPGSNWRTKDGSGNDPRYAAYFFGGDAGDLWVSMTATATENVYQVSVNIATYPKVIFCRMNGANATNSWAEGIFYNKTNDLVINGESGPSNMSLRKYVVWDEAWSQGGGHWEAGPAE